MKSLLMPLVLALLLAAAGAMFWTLGSAQERLVRIRTSVSYRWSQYAAVARPSFASAAIGAPNAGTRPAEPSDASSSSPALAIGA